MYHIATDGIRANLRFRTLPAVQLTPKNKKHPFRSLSFSADNQGGKHVRITVGESERGDMSVLLFNVEMHEDHDGAKYTYAPPTSANDVTPDPTAGLAAAPIARFPENIYNATNKYHHNAAYLAAHPEAAANQTTFQNSGVNNFEWAGVRSGPSGTANIDSRLFLKDKKGNYPIKQTTGTYAGYYEPATASTTSNRVAADPDTVPYAALGGVLHGVAGVQQRDFGFAINPRNWKSTPFVYADAGGGGSASVGEYSTTTMHNLGLPHSAGEMLVMVFPGSGLGRNFIHPETLMLNVEECLRDLGAFGNLQEAVYRLAFPDADATQLAPSLLLSPRYLMLKNLLSRPPLNVML